MHLAYCGGGLNGNSLAISLSGNFNETYQSNNNGGGFKTPASKKPSL